jgi:hypothetical protein
MDVVGAGPGSMRTGADQMAPFHWSALPACSTAGQNDAVGQETPVNDEVAP